MTFFKVVFILILLFLALRALRRIVVAIVADRKGGEQGSLHNSPADGRDVSSRDSSRWDEEVEEAKFRDI